MSMGMNMGQSLEIKIMQAQNSYQHIGELELLSLHRIKHKIPTLRVHPQARQYLISSLIIENKQYKQETGRKWYCLTPNALDSAVDSTSDFLKQQAELGLQTIEDAVTKGAYGEAMKKRIEEIDKTIKTWFSDNYEELLYDMNGKIPYPIVRRMRREFQRWAVGEIGQFIQPMDEFLEDVAKSLGLNSKDYDSSEKLWDAMKKYQ